jgi:hypothetical protein
MVNKFKSLIENDPQTLFSILLNPKALKNLPPFLSQMMVPVLKNSLVDALHSAFLWGLTLVLIGAVLALFLKPIKLSDRAEQRMEKEQVA